MTRLLSSVFETFEKNNILYCLLRDFDQIDQIAFRGGEVDLLVHEKQIRPLRGLLAQIGFVYWHSWGHAPHHFFFAYDQVSDCWLKLDIVTRMAYGNPNHALRTDLSVSCLDNRQRYRSTYIPSPEDEFMTLLLHCVLDKGRFTLRRRRRLAALGEEIEDLQYLSKLVAEFWSPSISSSQLITLIESEQWEALLAERRRVAAYLASRDRLGTLGRQIKNRVLRKFNRLQSMLRPQSPMVALLAPDGAGKSTLTDSIQRAFYFPVHTVYMGLYQKGTITSRPSRVRGFGFLRRLFTQWRRYLIARYHQGRGRLVIFDRYTYDSMLPPMRRLTRGQRYRRWIMAHACPAPDLTIVLDAPGKALYERKGEHTPDVLERQRQDYLELQAELPQMIILDATQEPEHVLREAISLIWHAYMGRQANGNDVQMFRSAGMGQNMRSTEANTGS